MEFFVVRVRYSLGLAVIVSLLLHAAVLFINFSPPDESSWLADNPDTSSGTARPRYFATLAKPATPRPAEPSPSTAAAAQSTPRKPAASSGKPSEPRKLSVPSGIWANRSWSNAERADMNKFLSELATEARPTDPRDLSQRALAMARELGKLGPKEGEDEALGRPTASGKVVEPYSLEMYFDAFVRKMNRSAAFVKNEPRVRGSRKALVEISLNSDGSLKSYRVLRSGDQAAEIAYIKSVIDRASPFSAFPPDIRRARDSLSIMMCIIPASAGGSGGFSRSFGAQDCAD